MPGGTASALQHTDHLTGVATPLLGNTPLACTLHRNVNLGESQAHSSNRLISNRQAYRHLLGNTLQRAFRAIEMSGGVASALQQQNIQCVHFASKCQSEGVASALQQQINIQQAGIPPPVRKHATNVHFALNVNLRESQAYYNNR